MKNSITKYLKSFHQKFIGHGFGFFEEPRTYLLIYFITFLGILVWLNYFGIIGDGIFHFLSDDVYDFFEYFFGMFGIILWCLGMLLFVSGTLYSIYFFYCLVWSFFK